MTYEHMTPKELVDAWFESKGEIAALSDELDRRITAAGHENLYDYIRAGGRKKTLNN